MTDLARLLSLCDVTKDMTIPDICVGKTRQTDVFSHPVEESFSIVSTYTKHYGMNRVMEEVRYTGDDYMTLVKLALRENVFLRCTEPRSQP